MNNLYWEKLGRMIEPTNDIEWLNHWVSASCAIETNKKGVFKLFLTGKDKIHRSRIGSVDLNIHTMNLTNFSKEAIIELGDKGTFDENGTGYPSIVKKNNKYFLYYLGWIKGIHVSWYNGVFLATSSDLINFEKYSKAPIFDRDKDDYLGVGSLCLLKDETDFLMWYTRFDSWGKSKNDHKHYYNIKFANSTNCLNWKRSKEVCINFKNKKDEYAIARPSVIKLNNKYYMWYCYRGESYKIGFAVSEDGEVWERKDDLAGIEYSSSGWDSEMQCYPFVFKYEEHLYMMYCGNNYGATGLGIAKTSIKFFLNIIDG